MEAWEKMPFVEIALMHRCALTQFSLLAFYAQTAALTSEWDKQDDTQSKIIRHKCIAPRRIMLSTKF